MSQTLDTTELDFDEIKAALTSYFTGTDSPFKDWNFSGSGLNLLLDVLTYNTHYNAILAHLASNEGFLSSARLRKNVVARAKTLGYLPGSHTAASTAITLDGADIASLTSIPEGTIFSASVGDTEYSFTVPTTISGTFDSSVAGFSTVTAYQGSLKTVVYEYDRGVTRPKFIIPDKNVDISHLTVRLTAPNSAAVNNYVRFSELSEITATTKVYFISENTDGFYEIEFGDDILGLRPPNLDQITLKYLMTDGLPANGATTFALSSTLRNSAGTAITINVDSATISASGGGKETIENIRANAPLIFGAQDRAVTAADYKALIQNASSTAYISVWGGEDNHDEEGNPNPTNGTVYISPKTADTPGILGAAEKAAILAVLENKGVLTLTHSIVDPVIIYLYFDVFAKYDSALTSLSESALATKIRNAMSVFDSANLQDYGSVFRFSKFLNAIDTSDPAILSTVAHLKAYKDYTRSAADNTASSNGVIFFGGAIDPDFPLTTTSFQIGTAIEYYLEADPADDVDVSGVQALRMYSLDGTTPVVRELDAGNAGTINYITGRIIVEADVFNGAAMTIRFFVKPTSDNLIAKRNSIISIDTDLSTVSASVDRVALLGNHAAETYATIDRQ